MAGEGGDLGLSAHAHSLRMHCCLQLADSLFTDPPCTLQLRLEHVAEWGTTKDFRVSVKTITGQALSLTAQGAAAAALRRADPREPVPRLLS